MDAKKLTKKETLFIADLRSLMRRLPHALTLEIGECCFNGKTGVTIFKTIQRGECQQVAFIQSQQINKY